MTETINQYVRERAEKWNPMFPSPDLYGPVQIEKLTSEIKRDRRNYTQGFNDCMEEITLKFAEWSAKNYCYSGGVWSKRGESWLKVYTTSELMDIFIKTLK